MSAEQATDRQQGGFVRRRIWRHRWRRLASIAAIAVALLAALFYGGGGWFFSGVIEEDALVVKPMTVEYPIEVTAVAGDTITLKAVEDLGSSQDQSGGQWNRDLWVGVGTENTSGLVGPAISRTDEVATRHYIPPRVGVLEVGDRVTLNVRAFWPNPGRGLDQEFEDVTYGNSLGEFPAWLTPADDDEAWAIYVHGKGADRVEPLRIEASLQEEGLTGLNIEYRNDPGAPRVDGGIARYGQTEWEDLDAAVEFALGRGAERFVLVGTSMGASIILGFMERSEHADKVEALVFDSPATDIGEIIRTEAKTTPLIPGVVDVGPGLTWSAMTITSWRFDISWSQTGYNDRAGDINIPMLIWAAEDDTTVPIETVEEFVANAQPDLVQFERVTDPQASHLMSWNVDPDRYDAVTRAFIRERVKPRAGAATS